MLEIGAHRLLVGDKPRQNVLVGVHAALLISKVVALATLFVQLCQAVRCLLKRVFQSIKMQLGRASRYSTLLVVLQGRLP